MKLTGIKAHKWQRISALYLLFYFPYLALAFFSVKKTNSTVESLSNELFTVFFSATSLIAVVLIMSHAWVGLRDIMIDYLPDNKVHFYLNLYAVFLLLGCIDLIWLSYVIFLS